MVTKYVLKPFGRYRGAEAVITTPQGHLYERVVYTNPNLVGVISPSLDAYERALSTLTFAGHPGGAGSLT